MSVQEQIRRAQELEGKLYTRDDIGSILLRFAKRVHAVIMDEVGEDRAAVLAGQLEESINREIEDAN